MDDLVYICTKIARQMDAQGLDRIFDAAEATAAVAEEARPLLQRVVELVDEVTFHAAQFQRRRNVWALCNVGFKAQVGCILNHHMPSLLFQLIRIVLCPVPLWLCSCCSDSAMWDHPCARCSS